MTAYCLTAFLKCAVWTSNLCTTIRVLWWQKWQSKISLSQPRCSHTLSAAHSFGSAMLALHILGTRKMCLLLWMSAPILVQQPLLPPILEPPSHISHAVFLWWGIKNIRRVQQMKWQLWTVSKNFCKLHISISVAWARQQPRPFYTIWYISELSPAHWRATFVRRLYSESFGFC